MKKPDPVLGLVVRYDYLWKDEHERGREEGAKERPCAVVSAVRQKAGGGLTVVLAPITHSPPDREAAAVSIPAAVATALGLDGDRSWIKTHEVNTADWNDPGIVPARRDRWEYGRLPSGLANLMRDRIVARIKARRLQVTDRDRIEKARERLTGDPR